MLVCTCSVLLEYNDFQSFIILCELDTLQLLPGVYDWLLYLPPWQSSNGRIFQAHASALVRLLLANVIGLSMVLSGAISLWHVAPSLVCNRVAPSSTPNELVSKYTGFVTL